MQPYAVANSNSIGTHSHADDFASVIAHVLAHGAAGELHGRCVVQLGCVLGQLRRGHCVSHARRAEADSRLWRGVP